MPSSWWWPNLNSRLLTFARTSIPEKWMVTFQSDPSKPIWALPHSPNRWRHHSASVVLPRASTETRYFSVQKRLNYSRSAKKIRYFIIMPLCSAMAIYGFVYSRIYLPWLDYCLAEAFGCARCQQKRNYSIPWGKGREEIAQEHPQFCSFTFLCLALQNLVQLTHQFGSGGCSPSIDW